MADSPPTFHLALLVFGDDHLQWFLEAGLPSQLSPGNLPALCVDGSRPVYHVFTTSADAPKIQASTLFPVLVALAEVRFHPVDDLVAAHFRKERSRYELLNHAYGQAMTAALADRAGLLAIWPDAIFSDGAFRRLSELAHAGVRCVAVAGNQAFPSIVADLRSRFLDPSTGAVIVPPRALVDLTLNHLSPYWEQYFADSPSFPSHLATHIQWRVGHEGILTRSSFLHPLFFVPTEASCAFLLDGLKDGLDASGFFATLVSDVPREVHVVTDSDELCLTGIDARHDPFRHTPDALNVTDMALALVPRWQSHTRFFYSQSLRFHRSPVTAAWVEAEAEADQVTASILDCVEIWQRWPALLEGTKRLCQKTPQSSELFPPISRRVERMAAQWHSEGKRVVIFGTGPWARAMLTHTGLKQCHIAAFVDSNPALWNTACLGFPIHAPGDLRALTPDLILVTSPGFQEEMVLQIQAIEGLHGEIVRLFPIV